MQTPESDNIEPGLIAPPSTPVQQCKEPEKSTGTLFDSDSGTLMLSNMDQEAHTFIPAHISMRWSCAMTLSLFLLAVMYFVPSGRCTLLAEGREGDRELRLPEWALSCFCTTAWSSARSVSRCFFLNDHVRLKLPDSQSRPYFFSAFVKRFV